MVKAKHILTKIVNLLIIWQVSRVGGQDPEYRSLDGVGNNQDNPMWGSAGSCMAYKTVESQYPDGISAMSGDTRPSVRTISNTMFGRRSLITPREVTDMHKFWGQFVKIDLIHTAIAVNGPLVSYPVPRCDTWWDSGCQGNLTPTFKPTFKGS